MWWDSFTSHLFSYEESFFLCLRAKSVREGPGLRFQLWFQCKVCQFPGLLSLRVTVCAGKSLVLCVFKEESSK